MAVPGTLTMTGESGTDGAAITGTDVVGSWQYSSAAKRSGNMGYRFNQSGTTANNYIAAGLASTIASGTTSERWRAYHKISAYPASGSVGRLYTVKSQNGTVEILRIWINSNGTLGLGDGNGTTLYTSTYVVPLNTFFRIEFVMQVGTTGTVGIIGFGAVTGSSTLTTTNSSTQAYYWTTTANTGSNSAHGNTIVGKNDTTNTWTCSSDFDDVQADSASAAPTWTSNPSTWVGPGVSTNSSVMAAAASGALSINGAKNDISTSVMVASTALMVLDGVRGQNSVLSTAGLGSLSIAPQTDRVGVLAFAVPDSMVVLSGTKAISSSIALAGLGGVTIGAVREQLFGLTLAAGGQMTLGPIRTQIAAIQMVGTSIFVSIPNPGLSGVLPFAGQGLLLLAGSDSISSALALSAAPQLAVVGSKTLPGVIPLSGASALALGPLKTMSGLWVARATPALGLSISHVILPTVSMSALGQLLVAGRVIGDIHPWDNVIGVVLSHGGLATLLPNSVIAAVLDGGKRNAAILSTAGLGIVLPNGMIAVIQN